MDAALGGALGLGIVLTLRDQASRTLDNIRTKIQGVSGVSKEMMTRFDEGAKMMLGGAATMGVGALILSKAFAGPINAAIEFESVMADINKVANFTTEQYNEMSGALIDMSKRIPLAASELGNIMAAAAQAGVAHDDLLAFTEDAAKMGVAFDISAREAGDAMAGLRSIFQLSQKEVVSLGDAVNHLANNMNATAPNILNFLNRAGGVGKQVGMTGQQIAAFGATFIDLKTSPETASRAFSSMAMKLTTASQAGKDAQAAFAKLGLSGAGIEQAFKKDATGAMMTFLEAVNSSSDPIGILRSIMGEGFADDIAKLAGGVDKLKGALSMMADESAYAGSMLAEYESRSKTVQNALQLLDNRFQAIRLRLGNILLPVFGSLVNAISGFVKWVSELPEPLYILFSVLTGVAGAALVAAGGFMMLGGAMKAWTVLKPLALQALSGLKTGIVSTMQTMAGAALPLLGLIALGAALYYAWKQNWGGIQDAVTAVVEGFRMAVSAGEDGIARVDAKTAAKLKELGIWDFAVMMGQVFYRVRMFVEGFVAGFKTGFEEIRRGITFLADAFAPMLNIGRTFLEWLGILNPIAKTSSETWQSWGEKIGIISVAVLGVIAAFQTASVIVGIIQGITGAVTLLNAALVANPIGAAFIIGIAILTALWYYWDDICAAFSFGIEKIKGWFSEAADWISGKWQSLKDAFTLENAANAFMPLIDWFMTPINYIKGKWQEFTEGFSLDAVIGKMSAKIHEFINSIVGLVPDWIKKFFGFDSSSAAPASISDSVTSFSGDNRAVLEETGYKFDDNGKILEEPQGSQEEIDARMAEAKRRQSSMPAAEPLAQETQNQATATAQATTSALQENPQKVEVKSNVTVKNEPAPVVIEMDGEKIAEGVIEYMDHEEVRAGSAE
ncbi:MAG: phage tail tape measure protein [Synergistaceae bacterium]|jgi:TP901 family phage tail tape measure protein|nr:phage tail tape measure protein [Synergistaceae bacterium]